MTEFQLTRAEELIECGDYKSAFAILYPLALQGITKAQSLAASMLFTGSHLLSEHPEWKSDDIAYKSDAGTISSYNDQVDWHLVTTWLTNASLDGDGFASFNLAQAYLMSKAGSSYTERRNRAKELLDLSQQQGCYAFQSLLGTTMTVDEYISIALPVQPG